MRWICLILLWAHSFAHACVVYDDLGRVVSLTHPAKRIISLAPDMTETLFAAGAGSAIVGVMQGSDYPIAARHIKVIGRSGSIDSEQVLALHPDLIVTWSAVQIPQSIKNMGIPMYTSHITKMTDIPVTLRKFGCLAGTEPVATAAADQFMRRYLMLKNTYAMTPPVSVFYQVWPLPLLTITKQSWIDDVITLCNGQNIFRTLAGVAPEVNLEAVVRANPDVMIATSATQQWSSWANLTAVKYHHIYVIDADLIERAGPRLIDGAAAMCQQFAMARLDLQGRQLN